MENLDVIVQKLHDLVRKQQHGLSQLQNIVSSATNKTHATPIALEKNTSIEKLLELTVDSIAGIHWWKDLDGVYRGCNKQLIKSLGFASKKDIIGKTDYELPWAEYANQLTKVDKEVIEKKAPISRDDIFLTKSGVHKIFSSIKIPMKDLSNEIIGTIGTAIDITKQSESIHNMEQRLNSIIDVLAGNHWWKDLNGTYCGCNKNLVVMLGVKREEVIGKTDYELPWADQADELVANDKKVIETGISVRSEEKVAAKSGKVLTFLVNKVPLRNERGVIIGTIGSSTDITYTKELEAELLRAKEGAEQSSKIKSDFIQNMEHDIRTPCGGIYQMAKVLEEKETNKEKKEVLRYITQASSQLLNVLNSIIDFSRIESGITHVLAKKFNLKTLIDGIAELEMPSVYTKQLELITKYPDDMPCEFIGDPFRIHRILLNLVSNAIKFTEKGYIKVIAKLADIKDNKNAIIKLIVQDTGTGISERAQAIMFEKFTREHPSNEGLYQGIGLGLRIVKQFTQELEGEIEIDSIPGQGSTFVLTMPLKIPMLSK